MACSHPFSAMAREQTQKTKSTGSRGGMVTAGRAAAAGGAKPLKIRRSNRGRGSPPVAKTSRLLSAP
jgi:hypothetical protein